jgi:Tol biopolymer transport system component
MLRSANSRPALYLRLLVLIMGTFACSFVTDRLSPQIELPLPAGTSGLIAYVGTDGNIYTIDQNGSQVGAITRNASEDGLTYLYPTWSPDGQRLSYLGATRIEGGGQDSTLFTANHDGKDSIKIYQNKDESPFYFYWSPDSKAITFLSVTASGSELSLSLLPARGGKVQLLSVGQPFYWDWSPDSQSIFIHTGGSMQTNPDARLALLIPDDTTSQVEMDLRPTAFQAPAWSPRGEEVLIAAESSDGRESLFLIDPAGNIKQTLYEIPGPMAFGWSPDASRIALLHSAGDPGGLLRGLKLLDPQAPGEEQIAVAEDTVAFFWSPDSRRIAYFQPVLSSPQPGEQGVSLTEQQILLSLFVYNLDSGSAHQVAQINPSNEFLNIFPFFDQYQRSATLWSPDSQHLVVSAQDNSGNAGIYVVDANGGVDPVRIADGNLAFWSWK